MNSQNCPSKMAGSFHFKGVYILFVFNDIMKLRSEVTSNERYGCIKYHVHKGRNR